MPPLVAVLIQQMPAILDFAREALAHSNPGESVPTDAEIIAAYQSALVLSLATDANWLAAHPE